MSGISSTVGPFSGIDSGSLISQLLQLEARPKLLIQRRIQELQLQQTGYLGFNAGLGALRDAAKAFRVNNLFQASQAVSSDEEVMTATAGLTAAAGSYSFLVDRLVSAQQMLSRGFADKDTSGVGAASFTFESAQARLDRDVALTDLKGGAGIGRGKIRITDSDGNSATIDLSKAATIGEVIDTINDNGTAQVTATIRDDKLVITDTAGGSDPLIIANASGYTTATDLGIAGSASGSITGSTLTTLASGTLLSTLNDSNGISRKEITGVGDYHFSITVDIGGTPTAVNVNIGDVWGTVDGDLKIIKPAVTNIGGVITRINEALTAAGATSVSASTAADGKRLQIVDTNGNAVTVAENPSTTHPDTTAADLGILGTAAGGNLQGKRILSGINTTLAKSINGGSGLTGDGVVNFTARDGFSGQVTLSSDRTLDELAAAIEAASGSRLAVTVNSKGTGLLVTDTTGSTASNLIITGTGGSDTAAALGISTGAGGVAATTVTGSNLQRQYISRATLVSSLNGGKGIGTGVFRITDSMGATQTVDIGSDTTTVGELIDEINSRGLGVLASINSKGDGIIVRENVTPDGTVKIKIEDVTGLVAKSLRLAGTAADASSNYIDGSYEQTVTFDVTDTLQEVTDKINAAGAGVAASIINDGSSTAPYRLSLTATSTGQMGRIILDSGALDLNLNTLQKGDDARVFYGSADPAKAILFSSSSNQLDNAVGGVKIDLHSTSSSPVTLTVSKDTEGLVSAVSVFMKSFNSLVDRIEAQTKYDIEAKRGGPLVGDGLAISLRSRLFSTVQGTPIGVTGRYERLVDIGIKVGTGGDLTLDEDRLRAALQEDPESVESLLNARTLVDDTTIDLGSGITASNPDSGRSFSELGILGRVEELVTDYVDSVNGTLTRKSRTITDQITSYNRRIADMDARLEVRRGILEAQFRRMEQAIGQLQQQQGSISSLAALAARR